MKKIALIAGIAALIAAPALISPALADVAGEIATAQTHAGLAAKAADVKGVHMHMHHALNCLVGPSGDGFDATNANPCAKAGNGAIPDSTDAAQKTKLMTAVTQLKSGLASDDMAMAAKDATTASETIASAK
jgi:hypothetical protein